MIFCIVHYNTPALTTCLVGSILKQHPNSHICIFDNSDKNPFRISAPCIEYFNNTAGKIINFDAELSKYPDRDIVIQKQIGVNFGSAKHSMSIDWLCKHMVEPFILLDSDVLIKNKVDFCDPRYACICEKYKNLGSSTWRCSPMLCYLNPSLLNQLNISFFDPCRMHALNKYHNMQYDTGASLYEDLINTEYIKFIQMNNYIIHYGNGSWNIKNRNGMRHTTMTPAQWLYKYRHLYTK